MHFSDGHYIKTNDGKCLGVRNQKIFNATCTNDFSFRWMWIGISNILNLKTLKCLEWNDALKEFTTAQCRTEKATQQWTGDPKDHTKIMLNDKNLDTMKPLQSFLFTKGLGGKSYKGKGFSFQKSVLNSFIHR